MNSEVNLQRCLDASDGDLGSLLDKLTRQQLLAICGELADAYAMPVLLAPVSRLVAIESAVLRRLGRVV